MSDVCPLQSFSRPLIGNARPPTLKSFGGKTDINTTWGSMNWSFKVEAVSHPNQIFYKSKDILYIPEIKANLLTFLV